MAINSSFILCRYLLINAKLLGIEIAKDGLLPEDKLNEVEQLKEQPNTKVPFIGYFECCAVADVEVVIFYSLKIL